MFKEVKLLLLLMVKIKSILMEFIPYLIMKIKELGIKKPQILEIGMIA